MHVYVHLARGFAAEQWRENWLAGRIIGLNDETPYGYHRAEKLGVSMSYSVDQPESFFLSLLRKAVRVALGFDLLHAWRNRSTLLAADVVWTHTESQHLGVAAVLSLLRRNRARDHHPRLIAQSVWLFDNWHRLSAPRRALYRHLMRRADVLTVLSGNNLAIARELFPAARVEMVHFGIPVDDQVMPTLRPGTGLNIVSVGNDRHRDWETLLRAVANAPEGICLKVVSATIDRKLAERYEAEVVRPTSNTELHELYAWADVAVVPLRENQHASGITAIEEAVVMGIPVVTTDVGGLRDYFSPDQVVYVDPAEAAQLRNELVNLNDSPATRQRLATAAQTRLGCPGLSSESYALRHVEISEELVGHS
jgi:glycosyltransferase involved in cell wall biosynthesis